MELLLSLSIKLEPTDSILEEIYCKSILEENIGFIGRYLRFSPERREWEEDSHPIDSQPWRCPQVALLFECVTWVVGNLPEPVTFGGDGFAEWSSHTYPGKWGRFSVSTLWCSIAHPILKSKEKHGCISPQWDANEAFDKTSCQPFKPKLLTAGNRGLLPNKAHYPKTIN